MTKALFLSKVTQPAANRSIHAVSKALVRRLPRFVRFPNDENSQPIKDGFWNMRRFPNVIGCVDGTHVWIIRPREHEAQYVNRKNYHSINVQVICDNRGRWINVVAKWPGSAHDSWILRNSPICDAMERQEVHGYILGDSGYRCRPWLMTPLLNPATAAERRYNSAHKRTRIVVEQSVGRWKRRFHLLHGESRMRKPEDNCIAIGATAVLHNIAIDLNEPDLNDVPPRREQPQPDEVQGAEGGLGGFIVRENLIRRHFDY